jgi:hypothetical protein
MLSLGLLRSTASKVAPAAQKLSVPAALNQTRTFVKYNWVDPLNLESQLTDEEKLVRYVNGGVGGERNRRYRLMIYNRSQGRSIS